MMMMVVVVVEELCRFWVMYLSEGRTWLPFCFVLLVPNLCMNVVIQLVHV